MSAGVARMFTVWVGTVTVDGIGRGEFVLDDTTGSQFGVVGGGDGFE